MKFWIVTPSFNQSDWLRRCIASVQDQAGPPDVAVHHHVQDGGSTDTTAEYLESHRRTIEKQPVPGYTFSYAQEDDDGMYDAINRGWRKATAEADVIAHINCDEQYLPGALQRVAATFQAAEGADVVMGDVVVIADDGAYVCHRRTVKPYRLISRFCCAATTAAVFVRAACMQEQALYHDTRWRVIGDKIWYLNMHDAGCRFYVLHAMLATFVQNDANLSWTPASVAEQKRYRESHLFGRFDSVVGLFNGLRRYVLEWFVPAPRQYAIYTDDLSRRTPFSIIKPTGLWGKRRALGARRD